MPACRKSRTGLVHGMTGLVKLIHLLCARLKGRSDSEHEQALVRVALVAAVIGYFSLIEGVTALAVANREAVARVLSFYVVMSVGYVGWIVVDPGVHRVRRFVAMFSDFAAISLAMSLAGDAGAPLYPLYLWVMLGNGFRFGLQYLLTSAMMGGAGFALVIAMTPLWTDHPALSAGLMFGIAALAVNAALMIHRLTESESGLRLFGNAALRRLIERFRQRTDSEHEQALVRVVLVGGLYVYFRLVHGAMRIPGFDQDAPSWAFALYELLSIGYVLWIVARPERNSLRRYLAMSTDFGMISLNIFLGGEAGTALYPLYLWVILGNGFRFGLKYLAVSAVMGVAGFSTVIALTSPWRDYPALSIGLLAGLVAIPGYAASLIRKLTEAKAQAEAASRAKSRFLAIISHELRTPLNAIIGMSDMLFRTRLDDDQFDMARTIHLSGQALLSLIDSVLDFSRIEAGKTVIVSETIDLHRNLAELVAVLRHQATEKGLLLQVELGPEVPPVVQADWPHIRQVLTNLLANAVKFTEGGRIALRVLARETTAGARLVFHVEDTGVGIPEEKLGVIFDAFAQAEDTVNRRFGGTGLGLAISRQLTELMGGTLSVRSRVGEGSCFSFDLPLSPVAYEPLLPFPLHVVAFCKDRSQAARVAGLVERVSFPASVSQVKAALAGASIRKQTALLLDESSGADIEDLVVTALAQAVPVLIVVRKERLSAISNGSALVTIGADPPEEVLVNALRACRIFAGRGFYVDQSIPGPVETSRRILVAEDNRVNIKVIRMILEKAGHQVNVVETGDALLEAMADGDWDIVVADVNMPGLPLIEAVKLHRMSTPHLSVLPVVALSADATIETRRECEAAGIDDYLTKPVVAGLLLSTIDRLTRERSLLAETDSPGASSVPSNIAALSAHPDYSGPDDLPVDWSTVDALVELGDRQLVADLTLDFLEDAAQLVDAMEKAVERRDRSQFRADCHALKSAAANVGARAITRLCQDGLPQTEDFPAVGKGLCRRLREDLAVFQKEMARYQEQNAPSARRGGRA